MKLTDHENRSIQAVGKPFTEIHLYLDQYFPLFRSNVHRAILHHRLGINKIVDLFWEDYGYEGKILVQQVAELHVADDYGFIAYDWRGLEEYSFFLGDREEQEFERCLEAEFGYEIKNNT